MLFLPKRKLMTLEGKNVFTQPIIKLLNYFPELNDKAFSLSVYFLSQNKPERTELSGTFKFLQSFASVGMRRPLLMSELFANLVEA